jgi:hypothetical protein
VQNTRLGKVFEEKNEHPVDTAGYFCLPGGGGHKVAADVALVEGNTSDHDDLSGHLLRGGEADRIGGDTPGKGGGRAVEAGGRFSGGCFFHGTGGLSHPFQLNRFWLLTVVQRQPVGGMSGDLHGIFQECGQVLESVDIVQLAGVNQAHEQVADGSAVPGLIKDIGNETGCLLRGWWR